MSTNNLRLVYSSDPKDRIQVDPKDRVQLDLKDQKCSRCGEPPTLCKCGPSQPIKQTKGLVAKLRLEKAGRGGKEVTVIYDLPRDEKYLRDLARKLKSQLGTGGTYKDDLNTIEIQGDHRVRVKELLLKLGFQVKGA